MKLYVYAVPPIDFWDGFTNIKDCNLTLDLVEQIMQRLFALTKADTHWEGDVRPGEIYISGLPVSGGYRSSIILGVKQDDNGNSFIVSPVELPWLKKDDIFEADTVQVVEPKEIAKALFERYFPQDENDAI